MERNTTKPRDVVAVARARAFRLLAFWTLLGLLLSLVFIVLGANVDERYYVGLLLLVPFTAAYSLIQQPERAGARLAELRREWGREDKRPRAFEQIEQHYRLCVGDSDPPNSIDNLTWSDLNLDDVYARLDRTVTTPGETVLYHMLRRPELDAERIDDRIGVVRLFERDRAAREALQLELLTLDREDHADLSALLWGPRPTQVPFPRLFSLLALAALIALVVPFFWRPEAWVWLAIPLFLVNLVITYKVRRQVLFRLSTLRYMGSLINVGKRIGKLLHEGIAGRAADLTKLAAATSPLAKNALLLNPGRGTSGEIGDILNEYIGTFFLVEVRMYCRVLRELDTHLEDLRRLYWLVGELDALQSVASFRAGLPGYCEPEFVDDGPLLQLTDGYHPLLADPAANSISIRSRGVFVSGSNMAGKSTFLRTVGVNAILAQAIGTCCATSYRGSLLRIISSINQADRLGEGKSYYLKEAERLLTIIHASEGSPPPLCIVDELLKGTNSAERFSASVEILSYLCRQEAIVIVASHDTDLARTLGDHCDNYHFSDHFAETGLQFDYRLRNGITSTRNAITLLDFLGYPQTIVDAARGRLGANEISKSDGREG